MTSRMHALMQSSGPLGMLLCTALLAIPPLSGADTWSDDVKNGELPSERQFGRRDRRCRPWRHADHQRRLPRADYY